MSPWMVQAPLGRALVGAVLVGGLVGAVGTAVVGDGAGSRARVPPVVDRDGGTVGAPSIRVQGDLAGRGAAVPRPPAGGSARPRAGPVATDPSDATDPSEGTRWRWPLEPRPAVVRPFRAPATGWGAGHRGLDLLSRPGARVLAVEDGRVSHVGVVAGRGTVSVEHAEGLRSTYEPVRPDVEVGDAVSTGEVLGVVDGGAASHCGVRACLHLGARRAGSYLDPRPLIEGGTLALLPLG